MMGRLGHTLISKEVYIRVFNCIKLQKLTKEIRTIFNSIRVKMKKEIFHYYSKNVMNKCKCQMSIYLTYFFPLLSSTLLFLIFSKSYVKDVSC